MCVVEVVKKEVSRRQLHRRHKNISKTLPTPKEEKRGVTGEGRGDHTCGTRRGRPANGTEAKKDYSGGVGFRDRRPDEVNAPGTAEDSDGTEKQK